MVKQLELEEISQLLGDVYQRFRNKEISKDQAKCESDLLKNIAEIKEIARIKEQISELKSILTINKK